MKYKAGFIAFLGLPNAGKSTLTNCLIREKVSIVTNKPQTTRRRITGIYTTKEFQAVLVDTPGYIDNTSGLNHFLQQELEDVLKSADAILVTLNLDAKSLDPLEKILDLAKSTNKPFAALITKSDLGMGHRVHTLVAKLENMNIPYAEISSTAQPDETREEVSKLLLQMLPESPAPLYPEDIFTTENVRDICAEIIREKCFQMLFEEIPYQLAVQIRAFEEGETLTKIYADIVVDKDNQKKIVVGHGASTLKKIGMQSREQIEKLVGTKVYLELHVKSKKKWMKDPMMMKELGYVLSANV